MKKLRLFIFYLSALFINVRCSSGPEKIKQNIPPHYKFTDVDQQIDLENHLNEISGIKWVNSSTLIAIDDNKSEIYLINLTNSKVTTFEIPGNYKNFEDLEIVDSSVFILMGKGNLLEIHLSSLNDSTPVKVIKEHFHNLTKADAEGLVYDKTSKRLLIAYKNYGKQDEYKPIFAYYTESGKFSETPIIRISIEDMKANMFKTAMERFSLKVNDKLKGKKQLFEPSAIAIHPISRDFYLLSAKNSLLAVYSSRLELRGVYTLPLALFQQPEGICFDNTGNLFISNEGRQKPANILKINYYE